jgi:hypothetical protein
LPSSLLLLLPPSRSPLALLSCPHLTLLLSLSSPALIAALSLRLFYPLPPPPPPLDELRPSLLLGLLVGACQLACVSPPCPMTAILHR